MAESEISISGALSFAWSLLSHNWRAIWGILALNALSWTVLFAGGSSSQLDLMAAGALGLLITNYPVYGAVFRLAEARGDKEPGDRLGALGIQWRSMEFRILAADLLVLVFQFVLALLVMLILMAPFVAMVNPDVARLKGAVTPADLAKVLGPQATGALELIPLGAWLMVMFLRMRLFLALPASALSGRVAVLRTWKLTRGWFWRIFATYFAVQAPLMVTSSVISGAFSGQLTQLTPAQIFGYSILSGVLAGAACTPLTAGLQAYFYRNLGPLPDAEPPGKAARS